MYVISTPTNTSCHHEPDPSIGESKYITGKIGDSGYFEGLHNMSSLLQDGKYLGTFP